MYLVRGTRAAFFCLLALINHVSSHDISAQLAAAHGNTTILKTQIVPGIVDGAQTRGTFDIIWSCVLTLTACVYSAIHLDVPPRNSTFLYSSRKIRGAILGLLGPEIVLFYA